VTVKYRAQRCQWLPATRLLLLAIITSASWLGSACSRIMSSLTVIAITPDGRPCKPVVRNRRLDLHLIEKRPSSTKSNVKVQACLVNFRDVSRIIPPAQTWCAVPPLAQASANPRQGAPKPPYPEGSWPSPPADGTPRLPYGTSPRRFGRMVSSAVPPRAERQILLATRASSTHDPIAVIWFHRCPSEDLSTSLFGFPAVVLAQANTTPTVAATVTTLQA